MCEFAAWIRCVSLLVVVIVLHVVELLICASAFLLRAPWVSSHLCLWRALSRVWMDSFVHVYKLCECENSCLVCVCVCVCV